MTINNNDCKSFFDESYQPPDFIAKHKNQTKQNRRNFLKSAGGMAALATLPVSALAQNGQLSLNNLIQQDPWLTLDATLQHLLPESETGPSAKEINATTYLYEVMTIQPTDQEEKDFILKGVGWLNGYAMAEKSANFAQLSTEEKEVLLRGISKSRAGRNWLNTLLGYIFQAMLTPESYGGNPKGIGWQWLEHQAGFPLPAKGQRYFELPSRARVDLMSHVEYDNKRNVSMKNTHQGTRKA